VSGEDEHVGVPFFLSGGFFGFSLGALVSTQWVERLGFASFPLLGLPAAGFLILFFFTGLHRVSIHEETPFVEPPVKREPIGFGGVLVVGAFLATAMSILYVFLNVHLTAPGRFGEDGLRWGGWTLFLLGISSAIASYGWGMLGRRWGPFRVVTLSQMAYAPLLFFLLRAQSPTGLLLLAIPAGLLQGGAVFPVVATAARRSRGLTPGLRVGLMVGGCWGVGGLVSMGCGELLRRGVPVARLLDGVGIFALLAAASAVWLSRERREGRRRMKRNRCGDPSGAPAAAQATEPPAPPPDAQTTPAEPHAPDGPDAPGTGGA
jgi:hypothetical protein